MAMIPASADLLAKMRAAVHLHRRGLLAQADTLYRDILRTSPEHSDALHLSGVIAAQANDPATAVGLIRRALAIDPGNAAAHGNLGSALYALRDLNGALASYDRAIAIDPQQVAAWFHRARVLHEQACLEAALASYDQAIALQADLADGHSNRGNVLYDLKRPHAALLSYDRAISIEPDHADAHLNRGNVLRELDRYDAALSSYDRAIAIKPDYAEAHFNRGVALNELKLVTAACASYDRALAINGGYAEARFNRSLARLMTGDFAGGWSEHEWRWQNRYGSNIRERRNFSQPIWLGEDSIAGQTILLYSEQGYGDTLQFCRYAALVAERGARVILEAPGPLIGLLARVPGVSQVIAKGSELPDFDRHCPLMSLPLAFKTRLDTIPGSAPYLYSDPAKVAHWRARLGEKTKPRIGLMWNGSEIQPNDRNRSMRLADLLPRLPEQFQYVSLQKNVRQADHDLLAANPCIADFAGELHDFSDTAALCECMDVVLSVCTSVAHLSAALGRTTWILLSFAADWRWLLDRVDSPWYPSVTLYRQETRGDWGPVIARVSADLVVKFAALPQGRTNACRQDVTR